MLIPCNTCQSYHYTDESPLWFNCDSCLRDYQRKLKQKHQEAYKAFRKEQQEMGYCDGCGREHRIIDLEYIEFYNGYFCCYCGEREGIS